jgi:hypothetical protein
MLKWKKQKKLLQDKVYVRMFEKKNRKNFLKKNVFEIVNIALNVGTNRTSIVFQFQNLIESKVFCFFTYF